MATTSTKTQQGSIHNFATGRHLETTTAVAVAITTGFRPRYVRVLNNTSSDLEEWVEGMPSPSARKQLAAGTGSNITTNGITVTDTGFTIGLDTDINVVNEQMSWMAFG
jgi:hypothetical protein